jgi:hypothetical protein
MADSDPNEPFFLIVANLGAGLFCVEGPMTDDRPWRRAAQRAKEKRSRDIRSGLTGQDRDAAGARVPANPQVRRRAAW